MCRIGLENNIKDNANSGFSTSKLYRVSYNLDIMYLFNISTGYRYFNIDRY